MDDNILENDYSGTLRVEFNNTMPEFSAEAIMDVEIMKFGNVDIYSGTLQYYGETLVSDNSKIERHGQWDINPDGVLIKDGGELYLVVDAKIDVAFDVTKVYAKDSNGNWVLVSEYDYLGQPGSQLSFNFWEAVISGSTTGTNDQYGSIMWTLQLTPTIIPLP
ncbi:MAG: hypothetical protein ACNA7V_08170 [Bacteroidales bacterium]